MYMGGQALCVWPAPGEKRPWEIDRPARPDQSLGSDVTDFFVCCAAVKHRGAAILSLKKAVPRQAPGQQNTAGVNLMWRQSSVVDLMR